MRPFNAPARSYEVEVAVERKRACGTVVWKSTLPGSAASTTSKVKPSGPTKVWCEAPGRVTVPR